MKYRIPFRALFLSYMNTYTLIALTVHTIITEELIMVTKSGCRLNPAALFELDLFEEEYPYTHVIINL